MTIETGDTITFKEFFYCNGSSQIFAYDSCGEPINCLIPCENLENPMKATFANSIAEQKFNNKDYYRAIVDGTGYTKGDKLKKTEISDETGAILSTTWFNEDTQLVIAAPPVKNINAWDEIRRTLGSETLSFGFKSAVGFANVPKGTTLAEVQVKVGKTNHTLDGTTQPTADTPADIVAGTPAVPGVGYTFDTKDIFELESPDEIANFLVIAAAGDATIFVTYYCEFIDNE